MTRAFLALALLAGQAAYPDEKPGEKAVLDLLEARVKEMQGAIEHTADKASWERAVPRLRGELRASLGIDRLPKPEPRNVRIVGTIDRGAYRIEKLVYETLPSMEVPAHLYVPAKIDGKAPAVLFVPGHWYADSKTKADFQAFLINMARMGFVVLAYDPFGQGERGISLRDHRRTELLVAGVAQQAIVDFESLCALEILLARPEVDRERVGITGASGGGYNSWIMAALDERIKVSVPVVGTSDFHEQISVVRERDWYDAKEHCHFIPGLLRYANNHEFAAMIAPRPLMVIAAHNDHSFRIPGNRAVVEYARKLYGALGHADRVGYFEDETEGHGYQKKKREAAYGWFRKWLKGEGDGKPVEEPATETPPFDAPELQCFSEHKSAGPGLVAVAKGIIDKLPKPSRPPPRSVIRKYLADALGYQEPPWSVALEREGDKLRWKAADGLTIPATLLEPKGPWKGALLAAADSGREGLRENPSVRDALEAGFAVVATDVRGTGELALTRRGWAFAVSLLLGENFVGRQAGDLVSGWRAVHALPELKGKPVGFLGSGPFGSMATLYAAVLEARAAWLVTERGFASYRQFIERGKALPASYTLAKPGEEKTVKIDREIPSALVVFDLLRRLDLPDLYGMLNPRPALALAPIDGDFEPAAESPSGRFAWPAPAAFDRLRTVSEKPLGANPSALVERGKMPNRVHVAENYETEIEKRWWLCGARDASGACRGTPSHDFDDKMGDPAQVYSAVVFNPVPGPPMGKNTRLAFRYWLKGSDKLRVQIYSLSNGYHRHLTLSGLAQGEWKEGCVDMTRLRRPDGSGGPLAEDERIDDIQFYAEPDAELVIDDIVLYDAAGPDETEPFPRRIVFTGGFDTGKQGQEWPGRYEIVGHEKPLTWKCAKSVNGAIRLGLRGDRPLGSKVRFRGRVSRAGAVAIAVPCDKAHEHRGTARLDEEWRQVSIDFGPVGCRAGEIVFTAPEGADLWIDDILFYEPGDSK